MSSGNIYRAQIEQPRQWLQLVAGLLWLVFFASNFFRLGSAIGHGVFFVGFVAMMGAFLASEKLPRRRRGRLSVRDNVLLLEEQPLIEHSAIALIKPKRKPAHALSISRGGAMRWSPLTIIFESDVDANALVSDLKWDAAQKAAEYTVAFGTRKQVGKITGRSMLLAIAAAFVVGRLARSFTLVLPTFLAVFFVGNLWVRAKVRVGTDGIFIRRILRPSRFVTYQTIESAAHDPEKNEIGLGLKSGGTIDFFATDTGKGSKASPMIDALFQRIQNARALFSSHAEIRSHLLSALKRDGRSLSEWRLAATSLSHEQYRVAATPRDVLENIVQDSAVAPDVRIGAAIALHADAGARVRVATETSALPELGAAIDAALDGDDPALEKAIRTLKLDA